MPILLLFLTFLRHCNFPSAEQLQARLTDYLISIRPHERVNIQPQAATMSFDQSLVNDLFAQVDNSGFGNYDDLQQPWKNMNVTFLCDVSDTNSINYDPYDEELNAVLQPEKIKLACQPKCWDMSYGGMGGH
jgi:hypothetical protein